MKSDRRLLVLMLLGICGPRVHHLKGHWKLPCGPGFVGLSQRITGVGCTKVPRRVDWTWYDLLDEMKATGHIPVSPMEQQRREEMHDRRLVDAIMEEKIRSPEGLEEAEAWYELIADWTSSTRSLNRLIRALAKAGQLHRALHWAEVMRHGGGKMDEDVMWSLLYECGRQRNFDIAETLLASHNLALHPRTLPAFLVARLELGHAASAERWLKTMEQVSDRIAGADTGILEGIAKAFRPDFAKSWWNYMMRKGVTPQREHYDALITACRDDFSEAQHWFQQLCEDGFTHEVSSYTALLAAAPNADVAEELLQRMLNDSLRPNERTYGSLVQAAVKSSSTEQAVEWLRLSQAQGVPSEVGKNAVLGALAREKRWEDVKQLMEELKEVMTPPDIVKYNTILATCARSDDEEGVKYCLESMKEAGHSLDLVAFNTMVDFHARQGQVETALQWIEGIKEAGFRPDAFSYSPVVWALARSGDTKGAAECLRSMRQAEVMPNMVSFSGVLHSFVGKGDVAGADHMLSALVSSEIDLDVRTFDMMIRLCNRQGAHQLACKWFQHAGFLGMTSACASAGCASLAAIGEVAETAALMQKFEADGFSMKVRAYASLAKAWAASGRIVLAVYTIGKMYAAGHRCTSLTWATILEALRAKAIRRTGEAELLLRCMAKHKAEIPGDRAMSTLLRIFGQLSLERKLQKLDLKVGEAPKASEETGEKPGWANLQTSALLPPDDCHRAILKRMRRRRAIWVASQYVRRRPAQT